MNRVVLLGFAASRPVPVGERGELGFVLLTLRDPEGRRIDRHRVVLTPGSRIDPAEIVPAASLYVEGRLGNCGPRLRSVVIAREGWTVDPAPPVPLTIADRGGTHASPRAHHRTGYLRRLRRGTSSEHLVWVRPTVVRPDRVQAPSS